MFAFVRYLYWSDWGDNPHIGRIGMDGTNRSVIIQDKITWPNGLTLDFINDRIYWADAREDYIEFASLDGSNRHTGEKLKYKVFCEGAAGYQSCFLNLLQTIN